MKYGDLKSGDVVNLMGVRSVILAIDKNHPRYPGFWLFVWFIFGENRLSFDALSPHYELLVGTHVSHDGLRSYDEAVRMLS